MKLNKRTRVNREPEMHRTVNNNTHKIIMKPIRFFSTLALLALPLAARAQPDPNNAPKGNIPVNRPVGGRGGGVQNMTPEQIKALVETGIKRQLVQANVTSDAQQTAVIDYIMGEVTARQKLSTATRALQVGLHNTDTTERTNRGLVERPASRRRRRQTSSSKSARHLESCG